MAGKTMIPLLAFAAWSGTGKTTLLKKLIPALCARGIRPGIQDSFGAWDDDKSAEEIIAEINKARVLGTRSIESFDE